MNVFQKVTLEGLKNNKVRTVVTIFGIILSVAMITGVATIITSLQNYLVRAEIESDGDWHVKYFNVSSEFAEKISDDDRVEIAATNEMVGFSKLKNAAFQDKSYLILTAFSEELYDVFSVKMIEGRLPQNANEVVVPNNIASDDKSKIEIGSELKLKLGKREIAGALLSEKDSYIFVDGEGNAESFIPYGGTQKYKVVGICERLSIEDYSAPGYTLLTKKDNASGNTSDVADPAEAGDSNASTAVADTGTSENAAGETPNVAKENASDNASGETPDVAKGNASENTNAATTDLYIKMKKTKEVYDLVDDYSKETGYVELEYHRDLLGALGVSSNTNYNKVLYGLGAILILIIMSGSILLINNAFSISVSQRVRQFGIMASVGATKKQLRKSVIFEGVIVGAIGIPLGLLAGIGGIALTLVFVGDMIESMSTVDARLTLSVAPVAVIIAAVVGILTIYISAYIPARKAAKKSAIESIKQTEYLKINRKKIKTSKLTSKLFGLEGTLASKNLKRNKKRYRSTVISLFVSIVLFISASTFGLYLKESTETTYGDVPFDLSLEDFRLTSEESEALFNKLGAATGVTEKGWSSTLDLSAKTPKGIFSKEAEEFSKKQYDTEINKGESNIFVHLLDDESFKKYLKTCDLDEEGYFRMDSPEIIAFSRLEDYDATEKRFININKFKDESPIKLSILNSGAGNEKIMDLTITKFMDSVPYGISDLYGQGIQVFLPMSIGEPYFSELLNKDVLMGGADYDGQSETSIVTDENGSAAIDRINAFMFSSSTPAKTAEEMKEILEGENITPENLFNIAEEKENTRRVLKIINIFSYGFILLISLITIANVFNTISTNITLRRREFAMLKSVGMTDKSMKKVMNFECIFYGLRALLYGLPVSILITVLLYKNVSIGVDMPFMLPWASIGISVFSVFLVVFVTMLYSMNKINKEKIIDALVNDN